MSQRCERGDKEGETILVRTIQGRGHHDLNLHRTSFDSGTKNEHHGHHKYKSEPGNTIIMFIDH